MEIQEHDRSIYGLEQWSGIVATARLDRFILPFNTEEGAIAAYREGDELYRLSDGWAILRAIDSPFDNLIRGVCTLRTGKAYPVLDDDGLTIGESLEGAIASGSLAKISF